MNIIEKIKGFFKRFGKNAPKALAAGATIATVGLATGCGADKEPAKLDNNVKVEEAIDFEKETKNEATNFKEGLKYDVTANQEHKKDLNEMIEEIDELQTEEELLSFLKDMYIENYEQITGDTTRTTEDIKMYSVNQDYVFVNNETEEITTHGEQPNETKRKLDNAGISYDTKYNVKTYEVRKPIKAAEGNIIDETVIDSAMIKNGQPVKVIPGDNYGQPYISVLDKMGTTIPRGLDYLKYIEKGDEFSKGISKDRFREAVKELEISKENQTLETQKQSEYGE